LGRTLLKLIPAGFLCKSLNCELLLLVLLAELFSLLFLVQSQEGLVAMTVRFSFTFLFSLHFASLSNNRFPYIICIHQESGITTKQPRKKEVFNGEALFK